MKDESDELRRLRDEFWSARMAIINLMPGFFLPDHIVYADIRAQGQIDFIVFAKEDLRRRRSMASSETFKIRDD